MEPHGNNMQSKQGKEAQQKNLLSVKRIDLFSMKWENEFHVNKCSQHLPHQSSHSTQQHRQNVQLNVAALHQSLDWERRTAPGENRAARRLTTGSSSALAQCDAYR